jgi:hypothetical protein
MFQIIQACEGIRDKNVEFPDLGAAWVLTVRSCNDPRHSSFMA